MSILSLFRKTPRPCENCKHWGAMSNPQGLRFCMRIAQATREHHPAQLIPMDRDGDADDNVSLWTSGKFGCVHWEAKAPLPATPLHPVALIAAGDLVELHTSLHALTGHVAFTALVGAVRDADP